MPDGDGSFHAPELRPGMLDVEEKDINLSGLPRVILACIIVVACRS